MMIRPRRIPTALLRRIPTALLPASSESPDFRHPPRPPLPSPLITPLSAPFFLLSHSVSLCVQVVRMRAYVDSTSRDAKRVGKSESFALLRTVLFSAPSPSSNERTSGLLSPLTYLVFFVSPRNPCKYSPLSAMHFRACLATFTRKGKFHHF